MLRLHAQELIPLPLHLIATCINCSQERIERIAGKYLREVGKHSLD